MPVVDLYGYHPCVVMIQKLRRSVMARPILNRDDRLELRATKEEKRLLAAAAAYERLDVTSFIMRPYPRRARWWTATSASSFPSATGHECWNCWRTRRSRR